VPSACQNGAETRSMEVQAENERTASDQESSRCHWPQNELLSSGSRRRMATVSARVSVDPAGLTARARPKARPRMRAANLQRHRCR